MKKFDQKTAVVTGAGSGIGQSLATQLAQLGCNLALADINTAGLQSTADKIEATTPNCNVTQHAVDVSDREAVFALAQAIDSQHSSVDIVINNAGVAVGGRISDLSFDDMQWQMDINFWGVVHGCQAFLPYLERSEAAHIVNVSSVFGLISVPTQGIYNASKFAVRGFTEALRLETLDSNINVSAAFPAGIKTNIAKNARVTVELNKNHQNSNEYNASIEELFNNTPERAAADIIKGIQQNQPRIMVGQGAHRIDWLSRISPKLASSFVLNKFKQVL